MVVQGPLDFNFLLGCNYVYDMGSLISSLFCVKFFLHEGRIVTIDQLSFISPNLTPNLLASLNGPYMQVVSHLPHIDYVETCSMPIPTDEEEPYTVFSTYFYLDIVCYMVHHLLGAMELDLSIGSLNMDSFQSILLPFDDKLLEAMASYGPWSRFPK